MSDTSKDIVIYGVIGSPFVRAIQVGLAEISVLPETVDTLTTELAARGWRIAG